MKIQFLPTLWLLFLLIGCIEKPLVIMSKNTPEETISNYFDAFNSEELAALDRAFHQPFVVLMGDERLVFEKYTDMVDFDIIKASGWSYSAINDTNLLYEDSDTAMIHVNFSRYKKDDSVLTTEDFTYLLIAENVGWKVKAAFSSGEIVLGNG